MNLPTFVRLTRCDTLEVDFGTIDTLSRDAAKNNIDATWWRGLGNLIPVAHAGFYASRGFQATTVTDGQDLLFEISESAALQLLNSRGLIDDP